MSSLESEFIPFLESKTKPGSGERRPKSYLAFVNRRGRLRNYLLRPKVEAVIPCALRKVRLGYLTPEMVEDYFKACVASREVSPKNLTELRTDLRMAIGFAGKRVKGRRGDFFDSDFIRDELRRETDTAMAKPIFDVPMVLKAVSDPARPLEHRALVAFAFCTLSRPSEQFALSWSDVNLREGTVRIDKATRLTATGYEVGAGTKVRDGDVPIFEPALSLLRELRKANMGSTFVFTTATGKSLNKERFKRTWTAIKKSLGLPDLTYYRLKATGNSFMASRGVPAEVRAKIARWASTDMANGTYRSIGDDETQNAGAVFVSELQAVAGSLA